MAQMLTDKERPLHRARPRDSLSKVAQARTLTVLPQLDGMRKARVVQFLSGSGLIRRDTLVFGLTGADLSKASLKHVALTEVSLRMADLRHADLRGTNLQGTDLSYADLRDAWLRPRLSGRDILRGAYLNYTDLRHADLTGAQVDADYLHRSTSKVQGATMPNGQKYEDWLKDREGRSEDEENSSP
jgi:Pentapeptide repeats (8 copies)